MQAEVADAELVDRSRRSDAAAFGELVERHQRLVFGVALARCHDPALAEDVAQEAFVAAWHDLDRLRDRDRVGPWVAGIARNLASSAVRGRARAEARQLAAPPADPASPEDEAMRREDRELLQRALGELPETYREALVLHYLDGESVAAIAGALGIREDLVKQRLSRGRRALRDSVAMRVESALARARVRPAFRAGVVAAVSAAGMRKAGAAGAAGKVMAGMTMNKIAIAALAVAAVGGGAVWFGVRATAEAPHATPTAAAGATPVTSAQAATVTPAAAKPHVSRLDPAARAPLLESIRRAREHREAVATAAPTSPGPRPTLPVDDDLDNQYIRDAVKELIPLLSDCYEQGLARDPKLAGSVVVDFTIEGEPGVGGVIGKSAIDPQQTTLRDPQVTECVEQTMYALQIDPPADGGVVHVTNAFAFEPAPPP